MELCKRCDNKRHIITDGVIERCPKCYESVALAHAVEEAGIPIEFAHADLRHLHADSEEQQKAGKYVKKMVERIDSFRIPKKSVVFVSDEYKSKYILASMFLIATLRKGWGAKVLSLEDIVKINFGENEDFKSLSVLDRYKVLCVDIGLEIVNKAYGLVIVQLYYSRLTKSKYTFFVSTEQNLKTRYGAEAGKLFYDKNKFRILEL